MNESAKDEFYIYMAERVDGLSYIGITKHPNRRKNEHKRSNRFSIGLKHFKILEQVNCYTEARKIEEQYIKQFNTFAGGLNMTESGGGKNKGVRFNTLGMRHSEKTKKKMRKAWASRKKKGYSAPNKGKKHKTSTLKTLSEVRKGVCWKTSLKLNKNDIEEIIQNYKDMSVVIPDSLILNKVKKSQQHLVGEVDVHNLKSKNGKYLSYKTLFCDHVSIQYDVTPQYIRRILEGNVGNSVHHTDR